MHSGHFILKWSLFCNKGHSALLHQFHNVIGVYVELSLTHYMCTSTHLFNLFCLIKYVHEASYVDVLF